MKFLVGYEVTSGEPVEAELHHLFISGVTRHSGKTTSLEAFVGRVGHKALVFRCGRGELGFPGAKRIRPFFRERTDWRFVEGLLSAHLHEKTKFYRGDIMQACRGARSLSDVHANVRARLKEAREGSFVHKVLTELEQYFSEVLPVLKEVDLAPSLELGQGVNLIDLEGVPLAVQQLVIASCTARIMEKMRDTVLVVPEAWKMVPQGRGSPVKLEVEWLLREGAKLGNYCWLDSQQMTGIDMDILRNVDIWLFGRQSLDLEKQRVAKTIPGRAVKADDIHRLRVGQFYLVQYGESVRLVYVRPAWMDEGPARKVARGEVPVGLVKPPKVTVEEVDPMDEKLKEELELEREKVRTLARENARLKSDIEKLRADLAGLGVQNRATTAAAHPPAVPPVATAAGVKGAGLAKTARPLVAEQKEDISLPDEVEVSRELPSLTLRIKRPKVEARDDQMDGRVALLLIDGFMDAPRTIAEIGKEANSRGWGNWNNSGGARRSARAVLAKLAHWGFVRIEGPEAPSQTFAAIEEGKSRIKRLEEE